MKINNKKDQLSKDQIDQCISILEILNGDTNQIFEIPKDRRIELITQAGRLSRPQRDEFKKRKKDAKKVIKSKAAEKMPEIKQEYEVLETHPFLLRLK
jgi:F0F1-type ATP synthase alpha subunit